MNDIHLVKSLYHKYEDCLDKSVMSFIQSRNIRFNATINNYELNPIIDNLNAPVYSSIEIREDLAVYLENLKECHFLNKSAYKGRVSEYLELLEGGFNTFHPEKVFAKLKSLVIRLVADNEISLRMGREISPRIDFAHKFEERLLSHSFKEYEKVYRLLAEVVRGNSKELQELSEKESELLDSLNFHLGFLKVEYDRRDERLISDADLEMLVDGLFSFYSNKDSVRLKNKIDDSNWGLTFTRDCLTTLHKGLKTRGVLIVRKSQLQLGVFLKNNFKCHQSQEDTALQGSSVKDVKKWNSKMKF